MKQEPAGGSEMSREVWGRWSFPAEILERRVAGSWGLDNLQVPECGMYLGTCVMGPERARAGPSLEVAAQT